VCIGGHPVRLVFAGHELARILWPPFGHLEERESPRDPVLTVYAWDSASTQVEPPSPPWEGQGFGTWNRARTHRSHAVELYLCGHGTFSLLDRESGTAAYWVRSGGRVPPWDRAAPFRTTLGMWAPMVGAQLAHAAAVGLEGRAALLVGPGGSGKSSTAAACLEAGLSFIGEDYVLLQEGNPPRVHSLHATLKLETEDLVRFPGLGAEGPGGDGADAAGPLPMLLDPGPDPGEYDHRKAIVLLAGRHTPQLASGWPVQVSLVCSIGSGSKTVVSALSSASVLRALAPSTLLQLPGSGPRALESLARIARSTPGYALELGRDRAGVVAAVRSSLEGPAAAPPVERKGEGPDYERRP
jgi:hypothetical protein